MILSAKGRYAVMAMAELAGDASGRPVSLAVIAQAQQIPLNYLEQIFIALRKEELVKAVRGPGGGYQITRAAHDITVADIMFATEENIEMTRCGSSPKGCKPDNSRCVTHDLWHGLTQHIRSYLESVSLADIVAQDMLPVSGQADVYQITESM